MGGKRKTRPCEKDMVLRTALYTITDRRRWRHLVKSSLLVNTRQKKETEEEIHPQNYYTYQRALCMICDEIKKSSIEYVCLKVLHVYFQISAFFSGNLSFFTYSYAALERTLQSQRHLPANPAVTVLRQRATDYLSLINRVCFHFCQLSLITQSVNEYLCSSISRL